MAPNPNAGAPGGAKPEAVSHRPVVRAAPPPILQSQVSPTSASATRVAAQRPPQAEDSALHLPGAGNSPPGAPPLGDAAVPPAARRFPFAGTLRCLSWNSNAFFMHDKIKEAERAAQVDWWMERYDCVILQESHSTARVRAFNNRCQQRGYTLYASHHGAGTSDAEKAFSTAGVAITVSHKFRSSFQSVSFVDVVRHAGVLTLEGPKGCAQIVGIHAPHTEQHPILQPQFWHLLSPSILPAAESLAWVVGDFNVVLQQEDA